MNFRTQFAIFLQCVSNTYRRLTDLRSRKVSLRIHLILLEFINNNCNEVNPWKTWVGKLPILFMYNTLKWNNTVFENHRKSRIQHCERSELRLHFEWTKVHEKCQKWSIWRVFENLKLAVKQCYQIGHFFNKTKICEKCQNWKI